MWRYLRTLKPGVHIDAYFPGARWHSSDNDRDYYLWNTKWGVRKLRFSKHSRQVHSTAQRWHPQGVAHLAAGIYEPGHAAPYQADQAVQVGAKECIFGNSDGEAWWACKVLSGEVESLWDCICPKCMKTKWE